VITFPAVNTQLWTFHGWGLLDLIKAAFMLRYQSVLLQSHYKRCVTTNLRLQLLTTINIWDGHLGNSGHYWTVFARNRDTAVSAEGNGDLQTLICVLVARPRRCLTLSNPVPWQSWMVAYPSYTLQMKMLYPSWPVMVHDTHTRRRRMAIEIVYITSFHSVMVGSLA